MPVVGIKAKQDLVLPRQRESVPCLSLESRQNMLVDARAKGMSVPCLSLESRQNSGRPRHPAKTVYHACRWNQGKTDNMQPVSIDKCTMPVVGIKAKLHSRQVLPGRSVPCLSLESRQNCGRYCVRRLVSVPCLSLESRQNWLWLYRQHRSSVPCLSLESRQNRKTCKPPASGVYHACRWNQGKTACSPSRTPIIVYHACRWNQGKTQGARRIRRPPSVPCLSLESRQNVAPPEQ